MNKSGKIIIPASILFLAVTALIVHLYNEKQLSLRNKIKLENHIKMVDSVSLATIEHAQTLVDSDMVDSAVALLLETYKTIFDSGYTWQYQDSMRELVSVLYRDNGKYKHFDTSGHYKDVLMRMSDQNLELLHQKKYDYKLCRTPALNAKANKLLYDNRNNIRTFRKMENDRIRLNKVICAAALSSLLGYDKLFTYHSSYIQKVDSVFVYRSPVIKTDVYKCRVNGSRIIWGIEKSALYKRGSWFVSSNNTIKYSIHKDVLTVHVVKFDGTENDATWSMKKLKRFVRIR